MSPIVLQFSMALLIDGYNLLHVTDIFGGAGGGTVLHRTRMALLDFLAASFSPRERSETTIVFDAAGAPPGLPPTLMHDRITVHFARAYTDADAMLEELIEQHTAPRSLTVVSSDHRVQRAARHRGASFVDSHEWYNELKRARQETGGKKVVVSKPAAEDSPDQVAYWLNKFSEPLPPEKLHRPVKRPPKAPTADDAEPPQTTGMPRESHGRKRDSRWNEKPAEGGLENPFPPGYGDDLLNDTA